MEFLKICLISALIYGLCLLDQTRRPLSRGVSWWLFAAIFGCVSVLYRLVWNRFDRQHLFTFPEMLTLLGAAAALIVAGLWQFGPVTILERMSREEVRARIPTFPRKKILLTASIFFALPLLAAFELAMWANTELDFSEPVMIQASARRASSRKFGSAVWLEAPELGRTKLAVPRSTLRALSSSATVTVSVRRGRLGWRWTNAGDLRF